MAKKEHSLPFLKNRKKLLLFRILVPLFSIIFILLMFEIFLRIVQYNPLKFFNQESDVKLHLKQSPNKYIRYELNPGYRGVKFGAKIRINSSGFRGREYDLKKREKFRICVLGDSVAFGFSLEEKDIFAYRLEKLFSRNGLAIEVLNLSVEGYDTLQEVKHFRERGLKFSPDLVIVAFCLNDIGHTPLDIRDARQLVSLKKSLRIVQFIQQKLNKLKLMNKLKKEMKAIKGYDQQFSQLYQPIGKDPVIDRHIQHINEILKEHKGRFWLRQFTSYNRIGKIRYSFKLLEKMAGENRFNVIIMILPFRISAQQNYLYGDAHSIIRHEAERCRFQVMDMVFPLKDFGFQKVSIDGVHFNPIGHKVIAHTLFTRLRPLIIKK